MSRDYAVFPSDGWRAGDRAYCLPGHGSLLLSPSLEAGRVYDVEAVLIVPGLLEVGLILRGMNLPAGVEAFSSNRFVKIRRGQSAIKQITEQTERAWSDAYLSSSSSKSLWRSS